MRYAASEKREIIDLVERSSLPVRRTLDQLGIPKSTFYGWYERYREGGDDALEDGQPKCEKTWNRIPDKSVLSFLSWRWRGQNCQPGSLPCATRRQEATSSRSPVFTGC